MALQPGGATHLLRLRSKDLASRPGFSVMTEIACACTLQMAHATRGVHTLEGHSCTRLHVIDSVRGGTAAAARYLTMVAPSTMTAYE
jgi:hypothetical protein